MEMVPLFPFGERVESDIELLGPPICNGCSMRDRLIQKLTTQVNVLTKNLERQRSVVQHFKSLASKCNDQPSEAEDPTVEYDEPVFETGGDSMEYMTREDGEMPSPVQNPVKQEMEKSFESGPVLGDAENLESNDDAPYEQPPSPIVDRNILTIAYASKWF